MTPITTIPELEALPEKTTISDCMGDVGIVQGGMVHYPETAPQTFERTLKKYAPLTVLHVPGQAPTVKPGREEVYQAWHGTTEPWFGCADSDAIIRVLAILPGKSVAEVRAGALRDAADALAKRDFLLPRGHAPMPVLVDYLRVLADEEAGK